jgi:ATP-dependent RNA helicase DeaD
MERLERFKALGLSDASLKALREKGFEEPTKIQELAIPILLKGGVDLVAQAQTGTGKTAAFGLPILDMLKRGARHVQALVLVPTRELALQVSEEINSLRGERDFHIAPIYGGQSINQQLRMLRKGVDVVVGTPGRVLDHIGRASLKLDSVSFLVLDEADEMLNMGFIEDVEEIIKNTGSDKRLLLFSATMPDRILSLAQRYMGKSEFIKVDTEGLTTSLTDQIYFEVAPQDKFEALCRIIDVEKEFYGIVFCRTKLDADSVARKLIGRGYDAAALHGDISQSGRERILGLFRRQKINILVATDVAARGIDISDLTHVINYSMPQDAESYVHRIGRTGRAGKEGTAITFITPDEYRRLIYIKKATKTDIRRERLPGIEEVLNLRKTRIKDEISALVEGSPNGAFLSLAREILKDFDAEKVVAALLKHSFKDEALDGGSGDAKGSLIDTKGTTRLFVAMGKADGMTPRKLASFIEKKAGIDTRRIRDVQVLEKFSFISVPFEDAEAILSITKEGEKGSRPVFERAKSLI